MCACLPGLLCPGLACAAELGRILVYEASRDWLPTVDTQVESPLGLADATFVDPTQPVKVLPGCRCWGSQPCLSICCCGAAGEELVLNLVHVLFLACRPCCCPLDLLPPLLSQVVPILRAGLVLLEQASTVLPSSQTYHVGYVRNEETLEVRLCALCCAAVRDVLCCAAVRDVLFAAHFAAAWRLLRVPPRGSLFPCLARPPHAPACPGMPLPHLCCVEQASCYLNKLPASFGPEDRILVSDIMLATGGRAGAPGWHRQGQLAGRWDGRAAGEPGTRLAPPEGGRGSSSAFGASHAHPALLT